MQMRKTYLIYLDTLEENPSMYKNASFARTDFLDTFEQVFSVEETVRDMLHEERQWKISFPYETSGPCYTYDSPTKTDIGIPIGIYMTFKSPEVDKDLEIFLHNEDKFYYTLNPINDIHLDSKILERTKLNRPRAIGNIIILIE